MTEHFDFLWNKIRERAKALINPISYSTFIENLVPVDVIGKKIALRAESELAARTITKNHLEKLREAVVSADVGLTDAIIVVEGSEEFTLNESPDDVVEADSVVLDKRYTFESYVVGSSNKFVFAAAKSVAENPGENFNPLYIYGGTGLGKTHLMQAIANEIAQKKPSLKVIYTTSEKFLNEYVDSMYAKKGAGRDNETRFRNRYRGVDVLLIDDIQFWAGKYGVQEAFFHAFNELFSQHKQIVISSDCPAKELTTLEERLRTRFEGGLIADIQPPDAETKIAILKQKAYERKAVIPPDVLEFLARDSGTDVRTLEGRLTKVIFASKLHEKPITLELAATALNEAVSEEHEAVTADKIIASVCAFYKLEKDKLLGKSKKKELVQPRQICAYLMCEILNIPLVSIGEALGGRDHTTVIHSREKVANLVKINDHLAKEVEDIRNIILKQ